MPRASDGVCTLPTNDSHPAAPRNVIRAADINAINGDIIDMLTDSLSRSGEGGMTADLDMGGHDVLNAPLIDAGLALAASAAQKAQNLNDLTDKAQARENLTVPVYVETRTALKALDTTKDSVAFLKEGGREGVFEWTPGDYSAQITADTQEGVYVKADAVVSTAGAWVRRPGSVANSLNIKWFGALGDGSADDTVAFLGGVSLITAVGGDVYIPQGSYRISSTLVIPDGSVLTGEGRGYEFAHRTKLLFIGTGAKSYSMAGATATVVANPDAGAPYLADSGTRGDNYSTLDLTSAFSAAIILGKASGLRNLGIYPNFNGVAGYAGTTGGLSDDWDVGVWARNADWWNIEDCNVIGHWRKSGLLVTAHDIGDGKVPSNELGHAVRSHFQGFRGITIRSPETVVGNNWGFAGTDFVNCLVRGLWHQSRHLATSSFLTTPFASPSGALEISGDVMRGVQFLNSTFIGRDDINMIFGKCSEIQFDGCYEESKEINVGGSGLANSLGSRMVGTSNSNGVVFIGNSSYGIDFSPNQTRDSSLTGQRYAAASGVFNPSVSTDDDYIVRRFSSYIGHRFRKSTDRYIFADQNDVSQVIIDASGSVQAKHLSHPTTVTIANDAAASIPTPKNGGLCFITCCGSTENGNFPDALRSGAVFYDVGTATFTATKQFGGANFIAVNTDVTGTTGTVGNVTVGVVAGNLRIENRQGGSQVFRYAFLA